MAVKVHDFKDLALGKVNFKRLGIRYERTEATLLPLLQLAVTLINLRRLRQATELCDQV